MQAVSVTDINALFEYGAIFKAGTPGPVLVAPKTVGCYYKDSQGGYWYQIDPATSWNLQVSAGITLAKGIFNGSVSVSQSTPLGTSPVYLGKTAPNIPPHTVAAKCFDQGAAFFPNEWTP